MLGPSKDKIFLFIYDSPWYYPNPPFTEYFKATNTVLRNKTVWFYGLYTRWGYHYHRNTFILRKIILGGWFTNEIQSISYVFIKDRLLCDT